MTAEQIQFINDLYEQCSECEGTGKDHNYLGTEFEYDCLKCEGSQIQISSFGRAILRFVDQNLIENLKLSVLR